MKIMHRYHKYMIVFLMFCLPAAGWGQAAGRSALILAKKSASLPVLASKTAAAAPRAAAVLDNARIEALVKRGKEKMIIKRALTVAAQHNSPLVQVVGAGGVNKPLLNQLWKQTKGMMSRQDTQNMLGMNAWLMVLFSKLQNNLALNHTKLQILEKELVAAQEQAEQTFRNKNPGLLTQPWQKIESFPSYRTLLAEAVAQRLSDNFLPRLNSVDRVRFLQIIMQSRFEQTPVPFEVNAAVLEKDVKVGLKYLGPIMQDVTAYGTIKKNLKECALRAAEQSTDDHIYSVLELRRLMVHQMESFIRFFPAESAAQDDWKLLIDFYKSGAQMPEYPSSFFLY